MPFFGRFEGPSAPFFGGLSIFVRPVVLGLHGEPKPTSTLPGVRCPFLRPGHPNPTASLRLGFLGPRPRRCCISLRPEEAPGE